jgi:hypothetical protein
MEAMGFIGPDDGKKQGRPVYLTASQLAEYKMNGLPGSGDSRGGGDDGDEGSGDDGSGDDGGFTTSGRA